MLKITDRLSIVCGVIICGLLVAGLCGSCLLYFLLLNAEEIGADPNLLFINLHYAQQNMILLQTATASLGVLTSYFSIYMMERPLSWHDKPKRARKGRVSPWLLLTRRFPDLISLVETSEIDIFLIYLLSMKALEKRQISPSKLHARAHYEI